MFFFHSSAPDPNKYTHTHTYTERRTKTLIRGIPQGNTLSPEQPQALASLPRKLWQKASEADAAQQPAPAHRFHMRIDVFP